MNLFNFCKKFEKYARNENLLMNKLESYPYFIYSGDSQKRT